MCTYILLHRLREFADLKSFRLSIKIDRITNCVNKWKYGHGHVLHTLKSVLYPCSYIYSSMRFIQIRFICISSFLITTHIRKTRKQNKTKTKLIQKKLNSLRTCVRSNYKFMSLLYCLQLDYLLSLICSAKFDENNKLNVDKNRSSKLLENFLSVRVFSLLQKFSLKKHVFFSISLVFSNTISIRITQAHRPKDLSIKWMRC